MYDVFNSFLDADTWHTSHDNDNKRFNLALSKVIHNRDYHPDNMGSYFKNYLEVDENNECFLKRIDDLVAAAHAIKDYLKDTQ